MKETMTNPWVVMGVTYLLAFIVAMLAAGVIHLLSVLIRAMGGAAPQEVAPVMTNDTDVEVAIAIAVALDKRGK